MQNPFIQTSKPLIALICAIILFLISSCASVPQNRSRNQTPVILPYLRLQDSGECYFIDDFLPVADTMVTGKSSGLYFRYYTYWNAKYKLWTDVGIMLSFYSRDTRCWSLFEEFVLPRM